MRLKTFNSDQTGQAGPSFTCLFKSCLLLSLLLCSSSGWSQTRQTTDSMPAWTVLALKLVSTTHVQPTTGIVIAAPDLVLVAVDFAREGDEIVVLDGGTDIVRHGRPARIIHTLPADKLVILKVQGLNRPAASLSVLAETELKALNLVAFPPAEMIAQGAAPVRASVKALPAITTTHPTLDPFPNVSGALTDHCGNLVAFNLAVDVQSMQPAASPRLAWPDSLKRAAKLAGTPLRVAPCDAAIVQATTAAPEVEVAEAPTLQAAEEPQTEMDHANEQVAASPQESAPAVSEPEAAEELVEETEVATADGSLDFELDTTQPEPSIEKATEQARDQPESNNSADAGSNSGQVRKFATVVLILALLLLASALAWWIYRQRTGKNNSKGPASSSEKQQPSMAESGSSEPGTVRFGADSAQSNLICLQLQGQLSDGESFSQQLPVSGPDWHAEIGRQDADIVLASVLLSRRHAKVQMHDGRLTISDLGSTNGTRLNDVPCLPGEVFLVQSGDVLQLGDITLRLQLVAGVE